MTDEPMQPAGHDELITVLAHGLCFDARGKPHRQAAGLAARIAAETLARTLAQSGFVVMKRASGTAPRTPADGAQD